MNAGGNIYLDHNATTPTDPRVLEAMLPFFSTAFGNASSRNHRFGWDAEEAVAYAREQTARLLDADPAEIIFTSGATEALNLALQGYCLAHRDRGDHLITCATEHRAVLDTCAYLASTGLRVTYLGVDAQGAIDLAALQAALSPKTLLVCLMHANNETGVVHPLEAVSALLRPAGIPLLTDATQTVGKIPFSVKETGVDMAAFSAHKLYGPKGAGGLFVRKAIRTRLLPGLYGGGQERGLRPGTLNVPGIVGLGKACELAAQEMAAEAPRLAALRDAFEDRLATLYPVQVNGKVGPRLPHTTSLTLTGLDGERLMRAMPRLAVSQGAACSSAMTQPSHVLKAMGLTDEAAFSTLRIGLGRFTTEADMDLVLSFFQQAVHRLQQPVS
ncbi:MAG: IscS subfamily cysteine desulfurase [Bacteroidia bacterium]